ncbi:hypothetical protein [Nocardia yunnanensis]|uniref:hypothetical protein n=1 Tax=Nocardia yunnanensis TaxID=2382165 RepID=UPI0013C50E54|nr:hypothetical protein [Nocardia yunnanensis]
MTVELHADEKWVGGLRGMLADVRHEAVMVIGRPVRPRTESFRRPGFRSLARVR